MVISWTRSLALGMRVGGSEWGITWMLNGQALQLDVGNEDARKKTPFSLGQVEFEGTLAEWTVLCKFYGRRFTFRSGMYFQIWNSTACHIYIRLFASLNWWALPRRERKRAGNRVLGTAEFRERIRKEPKKETEKNSQQLQGKQEGQSHREKRNCQQ